MLLRGALARTQSLTARLYEAWRADQFVLLVSGPILAEADDKFLECAVSGGADYVVSADADLLSLREVRGIPILDVPTFWQRLAEHSDPR